ncbi:hypothetical protein FOL47_000696 [Perkinsus chesapeaki]|uniref:Uncharacterized protein n=1 Tax=Perkinsus chesapeaki TaxID=330153 RepID=A0A7J6MMX1_PERCH|nr:hypothetical protein FOL47_000696 [Perkinsus chesapeaki]
MLSLPLASRKDSLDPELCDNPIESDEDTGKLAESDEERIRVAHKNAIRNNRAVSSDCTESTEVRRRLSDKSVLFHNSTGVSFYSAETPGRTVLSTSMPTKTFDGKSESVHVERRRCLSEDIQELLRATKRMTVPRSHDASIRVSPRAKIYDPAMALRHAVERMRRYSE